MCGGLRREFANTENPRTRKVAIGVREKERRVPYIFETDMSLPRHAPRLETIDGLKFPEQFFEALQSLDRIDTSSFPRKFKLKSQHKALPDVFQGPAITFVSESVRTLIESLENDVHQFIEVELVDRQGTPIENRYFGFHVRQWLDALAVEKSTIAWEYNSRSGRHFWQRTAPPSQEHFAVFKKVVEGHHLWADRKMYHSTFFCSDQFHDLFTQAGFERLTFQEVDAI